MRLEEITRNTQARLNRGLKFHSKENGQFFEYRINAVNKTTLNLKCKHYARGCAGFAVLKYGSIAVTPINPHADRLRFLIFRFDSIVFSSQFSLIKSARNKFIVKVQVMSYNGKKLD